MRPENEALVEEARWQEPAGPLYHYTTLDGLLGIMKERALWATHIKYLNDTSEFEACMKIASEMMREDTNYEDPTSYRTDRWDPFFEQLTKPAYVTSFSAEPTGDDLSQWRAYGSQHSGFSIGFSPQYLHAVGLNFLNLKGNSGWSEPQASPLTECEYFGSRDMSKIRKSIEGFIGESLQRPTTPLHKIEMYPFARYSACLKDEGFRAEKEWRIALIRGDEGDFKDIQFRRSGSLIVPYVSMPLCWDGQSMEIDRLVVGPTPHRDDARKSVEMLLKKYQVRCGEIAQSSIPYRSW